MNVKLAKTAGFCFGVKRAVETVYEQIQTGKKIYTYGPIIHNEEVVKDLENKGVTVIPDIETLQKINRGTVVIRSHGVTKEIYEILEKKGLFRLGSVFRTSMFTTLVLWTSVCRWLYAELSHSTLQTTSRSSRCTDSSASTSRILPHR